jgi:hypothetical protein
MSDPSGADIKGVMDLIRAGHLLATEALDHVVGHPRFCSSHQSGYIAD